mmetsp:Transcript_10968/g.23231  ORF Transcript_10968/g.23231 Transcript_10968/m.23231 type:complete len:209 (-) Transcript_10968:215-841(-)
MIGAPKLSLLLAALAASVGHGFTHRIADTAVAPVVAGRIHGGSFRPLASTVIDAPTREDLRRKAGRRSGSDGLPGDAEETTEEAIRQRGPLEWLEDNPDESRDPEDPFHILILDTTYEKPKVTIPYVASNLEYVLAMPIDDATEHSRFCYDHGMSCVGVWPRDECLALGRQLQLRDIVCRIVPFAEGGHRAWQAGKDADAADVSRFIE